MSAYFSELLFKDYDSDLKLGKIFRKYIKCYEKSSKILELALNDGLLAIRMVANGDLKRKDAMIKLYHAIRPFEEIDYHNNNEIMKKITDDETIKLVYKDMSGVVHGIDDKQKKEDVYKRENIKFQTKMTIEGALYLLIALARSKHALGKKSVKNIMKINLIPFSKYGKRKSFEKYLEKCKGKNKPILKRIDEI